MLKWQLRELSAPTLPLFTPLTGCLLSDKTSVLWLRPQRDASYLMFVSSIQLDGYFGHFHGILNGLCPTVGCCHGYAGCSYSGSLPGRAADCKQNTSAYAAPCRPEWEMPRLQMPLRPLLSRSMPHSFTLSYCQECPMSDRVQVGEDSIRDVAVELGEQLDEMLRGPRFDHWMQQD